MLCLLRCGSLLICCLGAGGEQVRPTLLCAGVCPMPHLPHRPVQGDNNWGDDRSLYPKGQLWLNPGHIMGVVVG